MGVIPTPATNLLQLTAMSLPRVCGVASPQLRRSVNRPESSARGAAATHPVWDRGIAGAIPAALTIFSLPPWSNISGIRLLIGTMQAKTLPAAPLPGGVKVARRFVKPHGVGASPTLAANFQGVLSAADGPTWKPGVRPARGGHPAHFGWLAE